MRRSILTMVSWRFALGGWAVLMLACAGPGAAEELRVVSSGGFAAALKVLAPEFEHMTGHTLVLQWGPSMGNTVDAVPQRLARGETPDVVIMVGYALDKLVTQGKVAAADDVPLAESLIGLVFLVMELVELGMRRVQIGARRRRRLFGCLARALLVVAHLATFAERLREICARCPELAMHEQPVSSEPRARYEKKSDQRFATT